MTRSVTRALKIIGFTLPIPTLPVRPRKIQTRRNTCPLPITPKPKHRSVRAHSIQSNFTSNQSPNLWCICRRSSFGNMIFCENPSCLIKWFHMDCLGMGNTVPSGDWFCNNCKILNR